VEDSLRMAVLDGIDNLEEDSANELVVSEVPLTLRDHPEQVPLLTELQHDVDASFLLDDIVKRDDVWVSTGESVKGDLTTLKRSLTRVESDLVEALDSVEREVAELRVGAGSGLRERSSCDISSEVDDTVSSETEDRDKLEVREGLLGRVVDDVADEVLRMRRVVGCHCCLGLGERIWWRRERGR